MSPQISIIITIFQAEKYIAKCIESILNQTYSNLEIIAVNDGSTDKSLEILNKYALKDSRIKIISQTNKGLVASRKVGLNIAKNEFIFYIDADDTIPSNAIEILVKNYNINDDIIVGDMNICSDNGKIIRTHINEIPIQDKRLGIMFALLTKKLSSSLCGKLIRKELLLSVSTGLKYTIGEDAVTNMLIADKFKLNIKIVNQITYNYIQYEGSMLNSIGHQTAIKRLQYINKIYSICSNYISDKKIDNALSYFMLEEFYSFLRDGGKLSDNKTTTEIVYNQCINNEWASTQLSYWRKLLLILYRSCPILGRIMRSCILYLRKINN